MKVESVNTGMAALKKTCETAGALKKSRISYVILHPNDLTSFVFHEILR